MQVRALALALLLSSTAQAGHKAEPVDGGGGQDQVVVVNAAPKLGDIGMISRLQRVLDARGMLYKLPDNLAATLDGRNVLIADVDEIRDSVTSGEFDQALKLIEADEKRVLSNTVAGDPIPALAELCQWRGLIAAALNNEDEAVRQFRAAYRFNPGWSPDRKLASPRVRGLVKEAHAESPDTGSLRVEADPDEAMVSIDGGEAQPASKKLRLPVGIHLVMVTASRRKPYSELVNIADGKTEKITIALDQETTLDRAARIVDETAAAPPGKARLRHTRSLGKLTGYNKFLVVEDGTESQITLRLYDPETGKVSKPLDLAGDASSAAIARTVKAALDPDNLLDPSTVIVRTSAGESHWYQKWYIWAGAAAIAGASFGAYEYATRAPTSIRGF